MPKPIIMPKLGFNQETSQIVRWLKQPGETVEQGDPIVEVTTDKVNMEVEAPASGILDGICFREGDTVPVTEVIAYIRRADEPAMTVSGSPAASPALSPAPPPSESHPSPALVRATPVAANLALEAGVDLGQVAPTGPGGRVTKQDVQRFLSIQEPTPAAPPAPPSPFATPMGKVRAAPAARRLADELGVQVTTIAGSGPRGRVQSADVQAERARRETGAAKASPEPAPGAISGLTEQAILKTIPLVGMRSTIATRMQKSMQESPHITFEADIDVTAAEDFRTRSKSLLAKDQPRISLTAVVAKASAWAIKRHPIINSRLDGQQILLLKDVNIGIAVALEDGLIVPVVHSVDAKGLAQIAMEIADAAERARTGKLRADDLANGTFTISNLGMFGIDRFTAIINPPQTAILAVGRVVQRFVPDEQGQPLSRPIMTVTLSADHRVIDGAAAARFMSDLRIALEHPDLLVV